MAVTLRLDQGDDETVHLAVKSPLLADAPDEDVFSPTDTSTWGPLDLTGCKLWFRLMTRDGTIAFEKTTEVGEGITITDAAGGLADVAFPGAETASLDDALIGKTLRLEVQIRSISGAITTLKRGTLTILRDRLT